MDEIIDTMTKFEFWGFISAIVVGTIPAIISILYAIKAYKKSQIDKYGSFLFEKQYVVYKNIFRDVEELNKSTQTIFISLNNEWFSKTVKELAGMNIESDYIIQLENFKEYVKANSMILPNDFLRTLYDFIQVNNVVRNSIKKDVIHKGKSIPNKDLASIKDYGELKTFSKVYFDFFTKTLRSIKVLVGTEFLSRKSIKYLKRKQTKEEFLYFADRQANFD